MKKQRKTDWIDAKPLLVATLPYYEFFGLWALHDLCPLIRCHTQATLRTSGALSLSLISVPDNSYHCQINASLFCFAHRDAAELWSSCCHWDAGEARTQHLDARLRRLCAHATLPNWVLVGGEP